MPMRPGSRAGPEAAGAALPVWDGFVRVFHWSLVACVLVDFFIADDGKDLHQWLGYIACGWVVARIGWGFFGPRFARFKDFFPTPARLRAHWQHMRAGQREPLGGHNPLGALMMLTLMVLVLALGVTGYLQGTDRFWGEEWLQEVHEVLATGLIALAALHAAAALVVGRIERVGLVRAMLTGVKRRY